MVEVKKQFVPAHLAKKVTGGGINGRKYITIHQTGNTSRGANAQAHANIQSRGNPRTASWHYQVSDGTVIQSFPHTAQTYQSGDGRGDGNMNSISIELCVNSDGDYLKTLRTGAALVKQIMQQENISIMNVVQHNKWSGKNCPTQLRAGKDGVTWSKFLDMVKGNATVSVKPSTSSKKKSSYEVAQEVIDGKWGQNPTRRQKLEKAGYSYIEVQGIVNRILGGQQAKPKPVQIAVDGSWGGEVNGRLQLHYKTSLDKKISGQPRNRNTLNMYNVDFGKGGSVLIGAMQKDMGTPMDKLISYPSTMIFALQKRMGTTEDGKISKPYSTVVAEMQRRLNKGTF